MENPSFIHKNNILQRPSIALLGQQWSTVSGGGYLGSLVTRLFNRDWVESPEDFKRAILPESQSDGTEEPCRVGAVLSWLRDNGHYLTPNGRSDLLIAGTVIVRNWLSLHFVLGAMVLTFFLGLQLVRHLLHAGSSGEAIGGQLALCAPSAQPGGLGWIAAVESWLSCNLPLGMTHIWWSPWVIVPVVLLALAAVFLVVPYWMSLMFERCRAKGYGLTSKLRIVLVLVALSAGVTIVDSLGQTIYVLWRTPDSTVGEWLLTGVGTVVVFAFVARRAASYLFGTFRAPAARVPINVAALLLGVLLFGAAFVTYNMFSHAIAWGLTFPQYAPAGLAFPSSTNRYGATDGTQRRGWPSHSIGTASENASKVSDSSDGECDVSSSCPAWEDLRIVTCDKCPSPGVRKMKQTAAWLIALLIVSLGIGRCRPLMNYSGLLALYVDRIVRAYLGASNPDRVPGVVGAPGAGVSVTQPLRDDDLLLRWPHSVGDGNACPSAVPGCALASAKGAPLHLVNVTVNETLDGQSQVYRRDLKGVGMAIGPAGISAGIRHHLVFANASSPGSTAAIYPPEKSPYRMFSPTGSNSGVGMEELTLGQWTGISGASFSTGMGSYTSIGLSLLAGFFNVRLGFWWDSGIDRDLPQPSGPTPSCRAARRTASRIGGWFRCLFPVQIHLLDELLARFPGSSRRWWYLSDGGHFENLGAYELIRCRLPLIIIVDAEADPDYSCDGLGNLVRKARSDFDAEIEFLDHVSLGALRSRSLDLHRLLAPFGSLEMLRRVPWDGEEVPSTRRQRRGWRRVFGPPDRGRYSLAQAALGIVHYEGEAEPGSIIVYLKPTLVGTEPHDIAHYHEVNPDFPHESTKDQFFGEAQWESYRKLGELIAARIFAPGLERFHDLRNEPVLRGSNVWAAASPRTQNP